MTDQTTVAPVPEPASASPASASPEPAPAPASKAAGAGKARRATGLLGQVVGVVGMVVCLALIVGVLAGRGFVAGAVSDVAGNLDAAVARTEPLLDKASTAVDIVSQRAGEAATAAEAIAVDPNATPAALQAVVARLGVVSQRYLELRGTYAGAREQIVSALDRLTTMVRFVPGVSVPQGPVDALAGLDEKAHSLDAAVMGLIDAGSSVQAVNSAAGAIAEKARAVETGLGDINVAIGDVQGRLENLRSEIARIADTVSSVITLVVIVLIVLLLYIALLHLVLFRSSRGVGRAAPPADPAG